MEYKCYNPECKNFESVTSTVNYIHNTDDPIMVCVSCWKPIDFSKHEKEVEMGNPDKLFYIKNKRWLNEWRFVNSGTHSDQIVQKPNLDLE
jgi:hypothetical protein